MSGESVICVRSPISSYVTSVHFLAGNSWTPLLLSNKSSITILSASTRGKPVCLMGFSKLLGKIVDFMVDSPSHGHLIGSPDTSRILQPLPECQEQSRNCDISERDDT